MERLAISSPLKGSIRYRPLLGPSEIRVLVLLPGTSKQPIHCVVEHVSLDEIPYFVALSYTWGPASKTLPIRCDNGILQVTRNLYTALKHFRQKDRKRTIWIDAICINQLDIPERNQQVSLMRDIYEQASRVLIWLGDEAENSGAAAELIRTASLKLNATSDISIFEPMSAMKPSEALRNMKSLLPDSEGPEWNALRALIKRPWFRRMWIIQEVAVSKEAEVHCGNASFLWDQLAIVVIFAINNRYIEAASDSASASVTSLDVIRNYMREGVRKPLLSLLLQFPSFESTDPKDKIFALLGLSDSRIVPDYRLTYREVFRKAAIEMITSSLNLDVLSFPPGKVEKEDGDSPSWVRTG